MRSITKKFQAWADKLSAYRRGDIGSDSIGIVMMLVMLGVIGFVGLMIMDKVQDVAQLDSSSPFYNASTSMTDAIQTGFDLVPIIIIVAVAAIILTYLLGFWGRTGGEY